MKKERATTSDEQRERMLIAEQIERAETEAGPSNSPDSAEEGLKRDEGADKVVLSISTKLPATTPDSIKLKPLVNPLKANPLKRPNVLKMASGGEDKKVNNGKRPVPLTAAERLIVEDQERKRRRMERDHV
jgi:DNA/RNA-binding protein KIN17